MSKQSDIRNQILAAIESGVYPAGTKLPTRYELMATFGVARATIDRTIKSLVRDGVLVSRQGSGTYIAAASERDTLTIYIVLNTDVPCITEGLMEREWSFIINAAEVREQCISLGCHEIERFMPAIIANPNARVIWNRPAMRSHRYIGELARLDRPQILINRAIPRYSYVVSDVQVAVREALEHVHKRMPNARIGLLPPLLDPELHYLAEREIYFYEEATRLGFQIIPIPRKATIDHGGTFRIASEAIKKGVQVLYIPDHYMTPYVVSLIQERGLRSGKDITLITSDWNEASTITPGLICLHQQWRRMFQEALNWVLQERPGKAAIKVPTLMAITR